MRANCCPEVYDVKRVTVRMNVVSESVEEVDLGEAITQATVVEMMIVSGSERG